MIGERLRNSWRWGLGVLMLAGALGADGPATAPPNTEAPLPVAGNGDVLRLAGDGQTTFWITGCYPCFVDLDGDDRPDIVGSNRYGTGAQVTCYRNVGEDRRPLFSEREVFLLQTADGQPISNPNRGWLLTVAMCDWDGDGRRDLLVGGWCRYLSFHKNLGGERPVFAPGQVIFDAKVFPGLDYGPNPDTPYQGVFIEPCDWDGDGNLDLLCGTYKRGRIYLLRHTGRDGQGLPILAPPVPLEADGQVIDFLVHGKPSAGDWDGDGDLDLMAGQYYTDASPGYGRFAGCYYFENVGDRRHPRLSAGVQLRDVEGRLLSAAFHSGPTMVDWNRDGTPDVIISGMAGTRLYLNVGTLKEPRLAGAPIPYRSLVPCQVTGFAYPVVYDLDCDGTSDLVVADGEGNVLLFRGLAGLRYASPVKIKAQGQEIDEEGCPDRGGEHRGFIKVAIADWNRDGQPDLVMWSNNGWLGWRSGRLKQWCLKFFPGTADPMDFGAPTEIQAAGESIVAGYRCKPDVADLDGDGLLDMVVACGHGLARDTCTLMFFKNVSTPEAPADSRSRAPALAAPVPLPVHDGSPPAVGVRTAARLTDWDGDGDLDLLTGNSRSLGVRFWENIGTKTKPAFAAPKRLDRVNQVVQSHHEVGVDAADLDGDGSLDLLVGNGDSGMIHYFRRAWLDQEVPKP